MSDSMDIFQMLNSLTGMLPGGDLLYTVLIFVFVLGILVFVHELGHYKAAKSVGIFVEQFSIGFGKEIWGKIDSSGTRWKVCLMPLGGYVQMFGEYEGRAVEKKRQHESFTHKSVLQRAWVVVAGPLANFVFALVVLIGLMLIGEKKLTAEVGEVLPDMPAQAAGLQQGDVIRLIDELEVKDWDQLRDYVSAHPDRPLQLVVQRGERMLPILLTPKLETFTDPLGDEHQVGRIGIVPSYTTFDQRHDPLTAIKLGFVRMYEMTETTLVSIYRLATGTISAKHIAGPLGIADMAGATAEHGSYHLLMFMVIISINLGIINLLPIPMLDGGQLVYLLVEAIKGSPVSEAVQQWGMRLGFGLVACLVVLATHNDIRRFEWIESAKSLIIKDNSDASIPGQEN
jgi:regulator of sigma E protease